MGHVRGGRQDAGSRAGPPAVGDLALLLLRIGVGATFLFAGIEKSLGGAGFTEYLADLGIPRPELAAPVITGLEIIGGSGLLVGLLTRLVSVLFVAEMASAIVIARLPLAADAGNLLSAYTAVRLEVLLAVACGVLALAGPGKWSIDGRWLRRHLN